MDYYLYKTDWKLVGGGFLTMLYLTASLVYASQYSNESNEDIDQGQEPRTFVCYETTDGQENNKLECRLDLEP